MSSIADLLHEAAETHHAVYRIAEGEDPDWASALIQLDRDYSAAAPEERWEDWYSDRLQSLLP